jgi:hypothetical protein
MASAFATPASGNISIILNASEGCVWYLEDVPAEISLQSITKYKGEALIVSASMSPAIGFSGDPSVAGFNTTCSFFNSGLGGKKLSINLDSTEFVARYGGKRDDSLSFGLDERPLLVQATNYESYCPAVTGLPVTVTETHNWGMELPVYDAVEFTNIENVGEKNHFPFGSSARCGPELYLALEISSTQAGPPAGAGQTYTFTGPNITFTLNDN